MVWLPDEPPVSAEQRGVASGTWRYEDVAQDGRVMLLALPHSIGRAVWQTLLQNDAGSRATQRAGIIPVLTRLVVLGTESPVSIRKPVDFTGCFQMAHTVDDTGAVNRIVLNMWTHATAPVGRTYGTPPADAGEPRPVGRVFAEHVFTKLFAPAAERKVLRLDVEGRDPVPAARYAWQPPAALLDLPADCEWLEPSLAPDDCALAFGVVHTDSNQHVNSLVYPRLFEEAALRRFARLARPTSLLARTLEVAYRKPMFAGQRTRILLRAFTTPTGPGAVGMFTDESSPDASPSKAHAFLRMTFR